MTGIAKIFFSKREEQSMDDDLDDGEIDSFIDSETHRCTTLISNRNPQKMRSKKDLDRRSASPCRIAQGDERTT
ncbi:unnamed protein product [Camellia sinensis]